MRMHDDSGGITRLPGRHGLSGTPVSVDPPDKPETPAGEAIAGACCGFLCWATSAFSRIPLTSYFRTVTPLNYRWLPGKYVLG